MYIQAIEPLIEYLDNNLLTLYTYLLRRNFKCLLMAIWQECLEELQEVVKTTEEVRLGTLQQKYIITFNI